MSKEIFTVKTTYEGQTVSLFVEGLPSTVILKKDTPVKVLKYLYESGTGLVDKKDGKDN